MREAHAPRSQPETVNHILHLLITVFLLGLWLPFWIMLSVFSGSSTTACTVCGKTERYSRHKQAAIAFGVLIAILLPVFAVVAIRQSIRVASEQAKPTTEALPYPEVSIAPEATPEATATPESSATPVTPTPAEPGGMGVKEHGWDIRKAGGEGEFARWTLYKDGQYVGQYRSKAEAKSHEISK